MARFCTGKTPCQVSLVSTALRTYRCCQENSESVRQCSNEVAVYGEMEFWDPEPVLREFRRIELSGEWSSLPEQTRRLRTNGFKELREARNAAIFAHGLASFLKTKVLFSPTEAADFDFVVSWHSDGELQHCGIQLKELVPKDLNPEQSLAALLDDLKKYPGTDTILAILLNRSIPETKVDLGRVPFREIWLFSQSSPDGSQWTLEGDLLTGSARYEFQYPGGSTV